MHFSHLLFCFHTYCFDVCVWVNERTWRGILCKLVYTGLSLLIQYAFMWRLYSWFLFSEGWQSLWSRPGSKSMTKLGGVKDKASLCLNLSSLGG